MANSELDFNRDVEIDEHDIMRVNTDHPRLYKQWNDAYAESRQIKSRKKQRLSILKAQVALEIKNDPLRFGIDKATDKMVDICINNDGRIIKAERELIDAQYDEDVLSGAVEAFSHRKDSINNITKLVLNDWHSYPRDPAKVLDEIPEQYRRKIKIKVGDKT